VARRGNRERNWDDAAQEGWDHELVGLGVGDDGNGVRREHRGGRGGRFVDGADRMFGAFANPSGSVGEKRDPVGGDRKQLVSCAGVERFPLIPVAGRLGQPTAKRIPE
jgi:hypothetical protein